MSQHPDPISQRDIQRQVENLTHRGYDIVEAILTFGFAMMILCGIMLAAKGCWEHAKQGQRTVPKPERAVGK